MEPITVIGRRVINDRGLKIVKDSEGCELTAYRCPAGVWTVGYGSTGPHVHPGLKIALSEAEDLLLDDLRRFEVAVDEAAPNSTDNQFSAMVCLAFNIGISAFKRSTVLRRHLRNDRKGAAAAFSMWVKASGKRLPGLVTRRAKEASLYLMAA